MNSRLAAIALLALAVIAGYGSWWTAAPPPAAQSAPLEPIVIGKMPIAAHALLSIADARGSLPGKASPSPSGTTRRGRPPWTRSSRAR